MYNFQYVTKKEAAPEKKNIIEMINEVQDIVRDKFTFQYMFVGSCKTIWLRKISNQTLDMILTLISK